MLGTLVIDNGELKLFIASQKRFDKDTGIMVFGGSTSNIGLLITLPGRPLVKELVMGTDTYITTAVNSTSPTEELMGIVDDTGKVSTGLE